MVDLEEGKGTVDDLAGDDSLPEYLEGDRGELGTHKRAREAGALGEAEAKSRVRFDG